MATDLLKIDCEGSRRNVFESEASERLAISFTQVAITVLCIYIVHADQYEREDQRELIWTCILEAVLTDP